MTNISERYRIKLSVMRGAMYAYIREHIEKKGKLVEARNQKVLKLKEPFKLKSFLYGITSMTAATLIDEKGREHDYDILSHDEIVQLLSKLNIEL